MQKSLNSRSQGADLVEGGGVRYRTWAPGKERMEVVIHGTDHPAAHTITLENCEDCYFSGIDERGQAGDLYKYRFENQQWPDPASRFNPNGVHGSSQIIDPWSYQWRDTGWSAPLLSELVIYELHVGTFTPGGTFLETIEKLDHLVRLGVNAIEIMPVADFPGMRNWGYDGVLLYAPARAYGTPNELRALVDAAHGRGLAVILDVVYNHLGPDGNYLGAYSREYFNPAHKTPWGDAFNFELKPVREFFAANPEYWRREFHVDGFRLDATHAVVDGSPKHLLTEITERVHSLGGFVTVEDERNDPMLLRSIGRGGLGLDACWADDFHHVVRVLLTGEREGYYRFYGGTVDELNETLRDGWLLHGAERSRNGAAEARECAELGPEKLIFCITNHDQIGNQAFGKRLNDLASPAAYRAASALLCLAPYTPLLFMGQEWAAMTPFQFFTDHEADLGRSVTEGRREEFSGFSLFRDPEVRERIPDPQSRETFLRSRLQWAELDEKEHRSMLQLYAELLRLRRSSPALQNRSRSNWQMLEPKHGIVRLLYGGAPGEQCLIAVDLIGGHQDSFDENHWQLLLSTNDPRFGGDDGAPFAQPEARVLQTRPQD
jgi:maltooligosyltrehalose trehalohydrolase